MLRHNDGRHPTDPLHNGKNAKHLARLTRWKETRAARNDEQRLAGQPLRFDVMQGAAGRAFAKAATDEQCRRCGMGANEHALLGCGRLQKHHVIAIRDGGHPHDPANLHTLCHFCHREWHTWWEDHHEWSAYMAAIPFRVGVVDARTRDDAMHAVGCRRCGISETRCSELRKRKALKPFEHVHNERDQSMLVCYWCQREWEVFWQSLRPDVDAFCSAQSFRPARGSKDFAARGGEVRDADTG